MEAWCQLAGGADQVRAQVGLAVDEALTNVIRHGYDSREDGDIEIGFARQDTVVTIEILDRARQVPVETIASRPLDDVRPGGLGVHLIRNTMDEAVWSHREGGGMRLLLVRDVAVATTKEPVDGT